jgi:hypothetical protein
MRTNNVWVRVHDLPSLALDDFLALWSLGTLFEKTTDIDMAFTRAHHVLRICIACLDSSLIPERMLTNVKDDFYTVRFEVEGRQPVALGDALMDDAPPGNGYGNGENSD